MASPGVGGTQSIERLSTADDCFNAGRPDYHKRKASRSVSFNFNRAQRLLAEQPSLFAILCAAIQRNCSNFRIPCEPFDPDPRLIGEQGGDALKARFPKRSLSSRNQDNFNVLLTVESHIRRDIYTVRRRSTGEYAPRVSPARVTLGRKPNEHFSKPGVTKTSGFFRRVLAGR